MRFTFKWCLFLKGFEPTLTNSPQCAIILCGILNILFWIYFIFNSIKYSLDQVLQHKYALWVYWWPGYRVILSPTDFLPIYLVSWLTTLTTRHKWRYFCFLHFGNLDYFFSKCLLQECQYRSKKSNQIIFSNSKQLYYYCYLFFI